MKLLLSLVLEAIQVAVKSFLLFLPSLLVYVVLMQPEIVMNRGTSLVQTAKPDNIHELIPNSRWQNLRPCGEFFDEHKNYQEALSCVNKKVWTKNPLSEDISIPRCFVISASSPDVHSDKSGTFNFVPVMSVMGLGAVVGVYQPETKTVFVVENIDAAKIYRHELQHFFLHLHDPITQGGGHHQKIWEQCEEPYYTPSIEAKMISAIKDMENQKK